LIEAFLTAREFVSGLRLLLIGGAKSVRMRTVCWTGSEQRTQSNR